MVFHDYSGSRGLFIRLNSLNIKSEIWRQSLMQGHFATINDQITMDNLLAICYDHVLKLPENQKKTLSYRAPVACVIFLI